MGSLKALKGLLWFITVYQFLIGLLLMLTPDMSRLVVGFYGSDVQVTPQFAFILKPLGAYMITVGLIALGTVRAAVPPTFIVTALAALFSLNVLYRIVAFNYVSTTFGIPTWHLIGQMLFLAGLAIALVLLSRSVTGAGAAAAGPA